MFRVLLNVLLHIPGDEKNQMQNQSVLLKYSCNICLNYKISVLFKYILLITHPSTERFRDEFSAKNRTTTKSIRLSFSIPDHTIAVHQDHTNLSQGYTSNPAQHHICTVVLHELLLFHSLQCFHCTSAAGAEGRCARVLKSQAPWNTHTAEPHTKS